MVYSIGLTPVVALTTDMVLAAAPPERTGSASAISETSTELGGALGIALLGSIAAVIYRSVLGDTLPAEIPPTLAEAARGTLGGAVAASAALPDALGAELLAASREAFGRAFAGVAAFSAALSFAVAALALFFLRLRAGFERSDPARLKTVSI